MSHETTFEKNTIDKNLVRKTLTEFSQYLSKELKDSNCRAKTVTVKVRLAPFSTHTHQRTLKKPITSVKEISSEALSLLDEIKLNRPVRLIGLRVSSLEKIKE